MLMRLFLRGYNLNTINGVAAAIVWFWFEILLGSCKEFYL